MEDDYKWPALELADFLSQLDELENKISTLENKIEELKEDDNARD